MPVTARHTLHPFIPAEQIRAMVRTLGKKISDDYRAKIEQGDELLVIVTLKGAIFFAADLIRELSVPIRVDFVRLASYGQGTKSSGTVRILKDIEISPAGAHVLILDEIVDSGRTLHFLVERLQAAHPKSIRLCSLLSKPSRREIDVDVAYLGREIEDKFVLGYGLDFGELYRNSKDIYYLEET